MAVDGGEIDAGEDAGLDAGPEDAGPEDAGDPDATVEPVDSGPPLPQCTTPPELDLYVEGSCTQLEEGIYPYEPAYELWSDGATKQRFIFLPPDGKIDTTDPDRWVFPVNTRVYKTFSRNGLKIETRLLRKDRAEPGFASWTAVTYVWSEDQRSLTLAPATGVGDALGTAHDVPSQTQCMRCHSVAGQDGLNGFSAIQLNHDRPGWTLQELIDDNRLVSASGSIVTPERARIPGDPTARAALGYLHANCGNCHGKTGAPQGLQLWVPVDFTGIATLPAVVTGCRCLTRWTGHSNFVGDIEHRIRAGSSVLSAVVERMTLRGAGLQMPPIATELADARGIATVEAWIDFLDPNICVTAVCPTPPPPMMPPTTPTTPAPAAAVPQAAAGSSAPAGAN